MSIIVTIVVLWLLIPLMRFAHALYMVNTGDMESMCPVCYLDRWIHRFYCHSRFATMQCEDPHCSQRRINP